MLVAILTGWPVSSPISKVHWRPIIPVSKSTTVQVSLQSGPYYYWRRDNSRGDEILFRARVDCIKVAPNRFTLCLGGLFVFKWREELITRARKVQPAIRKVTRCGWGKMKKRCKLKKRKQCKRNCNECEKLFSGAHNEPICQNLTGTISCPRNNQQQKWI